MANKKSKTIVTLESMTKEELIELIRHSGLLFGRSIERSIAGAQGRVVRRQAYRAFERYEKLAQEARDMPIITMDLEQLAARAKKRKEADHFYRRYERLWARADLLEFGPKKESHNATKQG